MSRLATWLRTGTSRFTFLQTKRRQRSTLGCTHTACITYPGRMSSSVNWLYDMVGTVRPAMKGSPIPAAFEGGKVRDTSTWVIINRGSILPEPQTVVLGRRKCIKAGTRHASAFIGQEWSLREGKVLMPPSSGRERLTCNECPLGVGH